MSAFDQPQQNKFSLDNYTLSQTFHFHSATVRTIAILNAPSFAIHPLYLTGSLDRTCKLYQRKQNSLLYEFEKDISLHQGYVYSVAPRPLPQANPGFLTAAQDARAFAIDYQGNPITQFVGGHESVINCITQSPVSGMVVTGGWDGHAKLWDIQTSKIVQSFPGHKHAVSCLCLSNGLIVTGSEDKALRFWDPNSGKCEKTVEQAHKMIIREFTALRNGNGFLTCSNDESIKRWTNDGLMMRQYYGHEGFIFTVCQGQKNTFLSGSQDRTVRIWDLDSGQTQQIIHNPGTVWAVRYEQKSGDILTGTEDYKFRILTKDGLRIAEQKEIEEFVSLGTQGTMKHQALDLDNLPLVQDMHKIKGKNDKDIKVFNKDGTACAYGWDPSKGSWEYIGEVQGQAQSSAPQNFYYEGDSYYQQGEYDHIFNIDYNGVERRLPFNDGGNPLVQAEKFCLRENIGKNNIEQIMNHIKKGSKSTPNSNRKKQKEKQKEKKTHSKIDYPIATKKLPMKQYVFYQALKAAPVYAKIRQNNSKIPDSNSNKLVQVEVYSHLKNLFQILQNQALWHSSKFADTHIVIIKKILKWPIDLRFPCIDALRMFILHPDSMKIFKVFQQGNQKLFELLSLVMADDAPAPCVLLSLQAISNMFKWPSSEFVLKKRRQKCLNAVFQKLLSTNKNIRRAAATIALNYSVLLLSQSDKTQRQQGQFQIMTRLSQLQIMKVNESSEDWPTLHRQLTSIGNCIMSANNNELNQEALAIAQSLEVGESLAQIKIPSSQKQAIDMYQALKSLF